MPLTHLATLNPDGSDIIFISQFHYKWACVVYTVSKMQFQNRQVKSPLHPIVGSISECCPLAHCSRMARQGRESRFLGKFHFLCTPVGEVVIAENHIISFLPLCSVMPLYPVLISSVIFCLTWKGNTHNTHRTLFKIKKQNQNKIEKANVLPHFAKGPTFPDSGGTWICWHHAM